MSELGTRLPIDTIEKGYRSGVRDPLQVVIRSQGEWNAFWKRHSVTNTNPAPAPNVDFDREMVVGIFLGEKVRAVMKWKLSARNNATPRSIFIIGKKLHRRAQWSLRH